MADTALVDRLLPGDHVCWSFADDAERRRVTAAYVRDGLRRHHQVRYLAAVLDPGAAIAELAGDGVDVAGALRAGRLRVDGADDTYLAGGGFDAASVAALWRDAIGQARRQGYAGLRALGDMSWAARAVPGVDQLAEYERQVNRMYADGYAMAVCLYDRRLFHEHQLGETSRAHPATVTPRTSRTTAPLLRMIRRPDGLRLHGEADLSNRDALATVLAHLVEDTGGDSVITLDLAGLRFADAMATRLIVAAGRSAGGRLRAIGAGRAVRRLLELQGADEIPGLLRGPAAGPGTTA